MQSDPSCPGDVVEEYQGWMEQEVSNGVDGCLIPSFLAPFLPSFPSLTLLMDVLVSLYGR